MQQPIAEKNDTILEIHGDKRVDPYFWMNNRENPKVIDYLNDENAYLDNVMYDYKEVREDLFKEIISRIKQTDESVPYFSSGYYYYTRFEEAKEYPIYCRKKDTLKNEEELLIDVNQLAAGSKFCSVVGINISPDNKYVSYGIDTVGRRLYNIKVKNIKTGVHLDINFENTIGFAEWAEDNKTLFYSVKDINTLRSYKVMRHIIGSDKPDVEVYTETDETFSCMAYKCKSDQYIFIKSENKISTEFWMLDAYKPSNPFRLFMKRESDHEYSLDHYADSFYIMTNWEAKNFRLMSTAIDKTTKENWKEIIPHRPDVMIEDFDVFDKFMVVAERKNGLMQIRINKWFSDQVDYINFGEEDYTAAMGHNPEFNTAWLRYGYTSLTTPASTFDYNMESHEKVLKKQQEVLGAFSPNDYEAKRLFVPSRDGKMIPVSIVYKKGIILDGSNPLLLYGYGSYGHNVDPMFSSPRLSLLNRGFIFAIAHIRGSQIYGREWYEDGKLLHKMNTFYDFIDCAEYLIKQKYTSPKSLFAQGGSAGGLLIGAVINMRPDLFKAVVAQVPFVDVISTMLDESIPLTTGEYDEWGNPNNKDYYNYMKSYSPYDNVSSKEYPAMLVTSGLHDSQVQYWEPTKWVAKLRELKKDSNLLLLHTNMDAGHGGASGRFEAHKETALVYSFYFKLLQLKPKFNK